MNKATFTCKTALAFAVGAAVFLPSFADRNITANITLNEDTDWTSDGTVNLSNGAVVDLNGHDLRVAGLSGTGRFISSDKNLIVNGSFEDLIADSTFFSEDTSTVPSCYRMKSNNSLYKWFKDDTGGYLYPEEWTYQKVSDAAVSVGYANSKDLDYSASFDAQDGQRSVWWWCENNQSKGGRLLSQTIEVDTSDTYRLSFFTAMMPGRDKNMRINVAVDGASIGYAVCSEAKWKEWAFDVQLSAGAHTITFSNDGTGGGSNPCGLLDNVSLFRKRKSYLRLCATSEGMYSCQNITVDERILTLAESQTLNGHCDWSGLGEVNIASGATIDLSGYNLKVNGLTYDTDARPYDTEFIDEGSFENITSWDGTFSWERIKFEDNSASSYASPDWCGDSQDGSRHVALYIQENSNNKLKIWQTVNVPIDGTYRLSFWTKARPNFRAISVGISVDGETRRALTTPASWQEIVVDIELKAGEHEIAFTAFRNSTDRPDDALGGGIDLVSLRFADAMITNSNNSVVSELHANFAYDWTASDKIALGGNLKLVKDLAEDLAMPVESDTNFGSDGWTLNLATHKLSVSLPNGKFLIVKYPKIENGTIAATAPNKQGWIRFGAACDVDASLEVNCAMAIYDADIRVKDYVVNYDGPDSSGGKEMAVYGTFKPNTDKFYGCTMLDQSTLDLSGRTSALPAEAAFTGSSKPARRSVSFEKDATVTVHVDGRADLSELARTKVNDAYAGYLMKWNTRPDASVKFILDGDAAKKYRLVCTDDGLVLRPPFGFMILMR